MTEYATVFLIFSPPSYGNTARVDPASGARAVASCDSALAQLPAAHWRRRVNLLQARALHRLGTGNAQEALMDLDLADQASAPAQNDPLFDRSQRVGLVLSRAFALNSLDRKDEAVGLLVSASEARPYDRGVNNAILTLARISGDEVAYRAARNRLARLAPGLRSEIALELFETGQFEAFLAIHPYLAPPPVYGQANELPVQTALDELKRRERALLIKVLFGSMRAYALTALGRNAEGDEALAKARADAIAGRVDPVPPRLSGPALEQYNRELAAWRQRLSELDSTFIETERAIARRRLVAEGRVDEVIGSLDITPLTADGTGADILMAIADSLPAEQGTEPRRVAESLRASLAEQRQGDSKLDMKDFFDSLPAAETLGRSSEWREARRPFLAMTGSQADLDSVGYRERISPDGIVTIRYRGGKTPSGPIEEMALLRAADLAREGGHKSFVILDRRDTAWSINTTQYGMTLRTDPNGHETELDVRFLDTVREAQEDGVVLDAEQVYAQLAPLYIQPPSPRRR